MNTKSLLAAILFLMVQIICHAQTDSMLCQGHYWTEDEANLMMKQFAGEWNDKASWEIRADRIRKGIIEGMQIIRMPHIHGNFNAKINSSKIFNGYRVENIAIESFPGFYITGNLYRPVDDSGKHAAILCPHGHWENGRMAEDMQIRCAAFARMGAIAFAWDMIGFGESHQTSHKIPIALLLQTYNSKRVLDYLLSRSDVDSARIGITGASGGASQSIMLTAIDSRIAVCAPVAMVSAHFFGGCTCESGMPVHKSTSHQTNNVEIAALCAPRPMLIVSDGGDWTSNTPMVEYPYIQKVYGLYHAEHKVENIHLWAEKHDYGYSKRVAVYFFFAHHLKLDIDRLPYHHGILEDFVTVLKPDDLKVFSNEQPLPAGALKGDEAVMKILGF